MFLTQEQPIAGISADSTLAVETSSQESVWQKIAVFQEIKTSWRVIGCLPNKAKFPIYKLSQKLISHVIRYICHCC